MSVLESYKYTFADANAFVRLKLTYIPVAPAVRPRAGGTRYHYVTHQSTCDLISSILKLTVEPSGGPFVYICVYSVYIEIS